MCGGVQAYSDWTRRLNRQAAPVLEVREQSLRSVRIGFDIDYCCLLDGQRCHVACLDASISRNASP